MYKICTSIEQSKKLIELGIDANTADMYWWYSGKRYYVESMDDNDFNKESDIPTWSLTALFDILPKQFDEYVKTLYWFNGEYHCSYENENWESKYWTSANNLIDACFKMILKLREYEKLYEYRSKQKVG